MNDKIYLLFSALILLFLIIGCNLDSPNQPISQDPFENYQPWWSGDNSETNDEFGNVQSWWLQL